MYCIIEGRTLLLRCPLYTLISVKNGFFLNNYDQVEEKKCVATRGRTVQVKKTNNLFGLLLTVQDVCIVWVI